MGNPIYDFLEARCTGAVHTAEALVIAGLDGFKLPEQKILLY